MNYQIQDIEVAGTTFPLGTLVTIEESVIGGEQPVTQRWAGEVMGIVTTGDNETLYVFRSMEQDDEVVLASTDILSIEVV